MLRRDFSLVLVTEWLAQLGPLVRRTVGWRRSDFGEFHQKSNAIDYAEAKAWRPDFKAELTRRVPLDTRLYKYARELCRDHFIREGLEPPPA